MYLEHEKGIPKESFLKLAGISHLLFGNKHCKSSNGANSHSFIHERYKISKFLLWADKLLSKIVDGNIGMHTFSGILLRLLSIVDFQNFRNVEFLGPFSYNNGRICQHAGAK